MHKFLGHRVFWQLLLLVIIGVTLAVIFHTIPFDRDGLFVALQKFSPGYFLASFALILVQIAFQISRLWVLCPRDVGISWRHAARTYVSGQFVSTFIQGNAGHGVKIAVARKAADARGRQMTAAESTAIILLDKIFDVGTLLVLTGVSAVVLSIDVLAHAQVQLRTHGGWVVLILGLGLAALVLYFCLRGSERLGRWLQDFRQGLGVIRSPAQVGQGLTIAFGEWGLEAVLLYGLCWVQGFTLSPAQLMVSLFVLNVGISVPVAVANLGTFEAALAFALLRMGVPLVQGVAIATLFHLIQMLGITTWMLVNLGKRSPSTT